MRLPYRFAWVLLSVLLSAGLVGICPRAAAADCKTSFSGWTSASCGRLLSWRYDAEARAFVRDEKIVGAKGPSFEYVVMERCVDGVDCGAAHTCAAVDGAEGRRFRSIAYALLPSGTRSDAPPLVTTVCLYVGQTVPLAAVEAAAHEEIRKRLTPPAVVSAPPGRSLVGLLTIYSTAPQPEPSIDITQPVPGEIRATPAYTWDFGDGLAGLGPGLAYQAGDLPSQLPGKYLGAVYRAAGTKHVTLTVTWSVRFRLEGVLDVPLAPIVFTATQDKQVDTARAVLVR